MSEDRRTLTETPRAGASHRLAPGPGELIDRDSTISFTFDGQTFQAFPGDTIASALAAAGTRVFSRSFKYHRPRGLLCCSGHCPNCLVHVEDEPNVRACRRPVENGMSVTSQNAWPSLRRDVMTASQLGSRFLPVGFYYKTFIRPRLMWPVYERVLRRAAGLGRVGSGQAHRQAAKQYVHADVAVVGAGPAGMSAAIAAAEQGLRVALFDEDDRPGGHLRLAHGEAEASLSTLRAQLHDQPELALFFDSVVFGRYEDHWLSVRQADRLLKVRAGAIVLATGAIEQPLLFDENDLPGVMLGSGVQRLLHLYGVAPGRRAVVITCNDDGWAVAADLQAAGIYVVAVADERAPHVSPIIDDVVARGASVMWQSTIVAASGRGAVERAVLAPLDAKGRPDRGRAQILACDLIAVSVGWAPATALLSQAKAQVRYDEARAAFLAEALPSGVFAAGRVTGCHALEAQLAQGQLAGRQAAAFARGEAAETDGIQLGEDEARRNSTLISTGSTKRQFLCYCEDVTAADLETAVAEGFRSMELLKRYSTISMGPCQGKMCSANTVHLCARANDQRVAEAGTTTSRPPVEPVPLGVLAGLHMEPVRETPVHSWHEAHGARMMVAGVWMRPEHYGDPEAEVAAVRQRVGLIDVSTLGKLRLTGPGVPAFLEKVYVNRWQNLAVGRARYGLMCNDEGVILDDGVTARLGDQEWLATTTSSGAGAMVEWLQWWLQSGWGAGVHLVDVSEAYAAFNLAGPGARLTLQQLTDADLAADAFPYMGARNLMVAGIPCRVLRLGFTGELSYEIHCPAGAGLALWVALLEAGEPYGIRPFGVEAQRVLRLEKGHVIVGQDTDALSDPLSAGLGGLVKLGGEDFLGQRSLRRIAASGVPQRLVGFTMAEPDAVPEEGLQIVRPGTAGRDEIIGWVTSCRWSPTLRRTIGLCWLPADIAGQVGAPFMIRMQGRHVQGRVHHGAFYDPDGARLRS